MTLAITNGRAPSLDHTFDHAGNMRVQNVGSEASPTTITYTHDLWNRLVKLDYGGTVRAVYALQWVELADQQAGGYH